MITTQYSTKDRRKFSVLIIFFTLGLFLIQTPKTYAADICKEGLKDLQNSQGEIQDKGGIWGYLEKSSHLKNDSILGLQIDGKLQRLVVSFETLCDEGKTPTPKLYNLILNLMGDARMIFNRKADKQPKEKVLENLQGFNKRIEELLAQITT